VEFHKAQVFIIGTIQAASLWALHRLTYIQATSWQDLWMNIFYVWASGLCGNDCVIITVYLLVRAGKLTIYLCILSLASVALTLTTFFRSASLTVSPEQVVPGPVGLPECGGGLPTQYCLRNPGVTQIVREGKRQSTKYMIGSCVVLGLIFAANFRWFNLDGNKQADKVNIFRVTRTRTTRREGRPRTTWLGRILHSASIICVEAWLLYRVISDVQVYRAWILMGLSGNWSPGSIIAVAVWVPVLVEYGRLVIGG
jgi:hypothetical protein